MNEVDKFVIEWMLERVKALIVDENHIRDDIYAAAHFLTEKGVRDGLCRYIIKSDKEVMAMCSILSRDFFHTSERVLKEMNQTYAEKMGTADQYPVPSDKDSDNYLACGTAYNLEEEIYLSSMRSGRVDTDALIDSFEYMWGRSQYAQNRWDYVHWVKEYLEKLL